MTPINFGLPGFFRVSGEVVVGQEGNLPPITSGLQLYISPQQETYSDAGSTLATNGDNIRQINDLSANNNHITQTTASNQLSYETEVFNKKSFLNYSTGEFMTPTSDFSLAGGTIYFTGSFTSGELALLGGASDSKILGQVSNSFWLWDGSIGSNISISNSIKQHAVYAAKWTLGGDLELYRNGISLGSVSVSTISSTTFDRLFSRSSGNSGSGYYGDLLVYNNAHSLSEIQQITDFLTETTYTVSGYTENPSERKFLLHHFVADVDVYKNSSNDAAADGDSVYSISDLTFFDNRGVQASSSLQPEYVASEPAIGNHNYIKSNNSGDVLSLDNDIVINEHTDFTLFGVVKKDSVNDDFTLYGGNSTEGLVIEYNTSMYFDSGGISTSVPSIGTDWSIISASYDSDNNTLKVFKNGTQLGTDKTVSFGEININRIMNRGNSITSSNASIAECMLYNTLLTSAEIEAEESRLNNKYLIYTNAPITTNLDLHINVDAYKSFSDEGTTLATDGDNLRQINDLSFDKNNISQSTASNQLVYETEFFNKKDFAKHLSQDYMNPSTSFNLAGGTIYVTGKKALETSDWVIVGGDSSGVAASNWSDGNTYLRDSSNNLVSLSIGHFVEHAVYAFVWDYGNTFEVFKNGVSLGSVDASSVGTLNNVKIFGRGQETATSENYFGDVLVYSDAHTSTQVEEISNFLIGETYEVDSYTKEPTYKKFLVHHFEAESSSLKTGGATPTNGDSIASVNDLTFNDNDGTVSSTAPTYYDSVSDINDKAYLQLGGGSGVVNLSTPITMERAEDFTIFAVVKKDNTSDSLALYGGDNNIALFVDYSDGNMYFLNGSNNATVSSLGTGWAIISVVYDAKADTLKVYKNGSQVGTTQSWSMTGSYTINRLFNRGNTTTTSGSGVAECMFYRTKLSSTEIAAEESRLNTKYDIY